jgi:hypothetical protein
MVCPSFWEDYYMLIYTHCWELMNSVGSHGSLSLLFVMKVTVCHFVNDSHEVMTALIVVLTIIVIVEISLQLHQALSALCFRRGGMKIQLLYQMLSDFLGIKKIFRRSVVQLLLDLGLESSTATRACQAVFSTV